MFSDKGLKLSHLEERLAVRTDADLFRSVTPATDLDSGAGTGQVSERIARPPVTSDARISRQQDENENRDDDKGIHHWGTQVSLNFGRERQSWSQTRGSLRKPKPRTPRRSGVRYAPTPIRVSLARAQVRGESPKQLA